MDEINPNNLGKPVYDEDQVILFKDLQMFIDDLDATCEGSQMTPDEMIAYNAVIETLLTLQDWLKVGKRIKIDWGTSYWEEI